MPCLGALFLLLVCYGLIQNDTWYMEELSTCKNIHFTFLARVPHILHGIYLIVGRAAKYHV